MRPRAGRIPRAPRPSVEPLELRNLLASSSAWQNLTAPPDPDQVLLVRFADTLAQRQVDSIFTRIQARVIQTFDDGPTALLLPSEAARDSALRKLAGKSWVVYAEADASVQTHDVPVPNDPSYGQLWGLNNANDVDVDAPAAWSTLGSSTSAGAGVLVAVLDTGIDLTHPDLQGRVYVNPGEIPGNGVDDDRNGYIDDVHGWNFASRSGNVQDDNDHGTHVSGTIAANASNGIGVSGVAPGVTILPVKILDANGSGTTLDAVNGIYYAAARGARVINASWGGPGYSQSLADAIRAVGQPSGAANGKGVVFVAAAGNDGTNNDNRGSYPANNRFGTTISVAAVDSSGRLASFSNFGARTVDLAAPGVSIYSTIPGGYATYSGTSMATPHVVGVVALAAAQNPNETAAQLTTRVITHTKPLTSLAGKTISGGLASAGRSLDPQSPPSSSGGGGGASSGNTSSPSGGSSAPTPASPTPSVITPDFVRASILGSDEFYAQSGGTDRSFVDAVYRAALGRSADAAGLSFWVGQIRGTSRADVARSIFSSNEAERTKVARWYQNDLGRGTGLETLKWDTGVGFWADILSSGTSDSAVRSSLLGSDEFVRGSGGTTATFLTALYQTSLGRSGSATELANAAVWLRSGASRTQLAQAILISNEARRAMVASWYISDLGRTQSLAALKSDSGVAFWAGQIAAV